MSGHDETEEGARPPEGEPAPENLRKNLTARLQKMLSTDEGVRALVGAVVPKELIANTLEQVDGARNEAVAIVGRELRTFLEHLDVGEELAKILTSVSFEIRMEVRFIPNEDGTLRANVRGGAKPKVAEEGKKRRWRRGKGDPDAEPESEGAEPEPTPEPEPVVPVATPRPDSGGYAPVDDVGDEGPRGRRKLGRRSITNMVQSVADAAASTARVAAEVAADAAAEVVNEARRNRADDDDLDTY